jgi:membrane protein DedA with SNARE-associated domain
MEQLALLLDQYGYALLFVVGFLEYAGAPIASVPVLVVAGALSAMGGPPLPGIVLAAALGGLLGDLVWYSVARWRGQGIVDTVCALSSNPMACIIGVQKRLKAVGPRYLLPAKFLPGAGNLVAAASGFSCLRLRTFLLMDGLGLLIWASVYGGVGWLFSAQVESAIEWASSFTIWLVAAGSALIAGAATWRIAKVHMHKAAHEAMRAAEASPAADEATGIEVAASA